MKEMSLLDLPFDQYQRYQVIREILSLFQPANITMKMVDVGGFSSDFNSRNYLPARHFFPGQQVFTLDREFSREKTYIQADGLNVPFRNDSVPASGRTAGHVAAPF